MKTKTYYRLVIEIIGETPTCFSSECFDTINEAKEHYLINFKNRNKGDEYDKYWNNIPLIIQKVIIKTEIVENDSNSMVIVEAKSE